MLIALLVPLSLAILLFALILARSAIAKRASRTSRPRWLGAVVNFFDTLGIGRFAPTTAWLKFRTLVPDRLIPPTMLVGLTPPAMAESIIFLILLGVLVDPVLLFGCVLAIVDRRPGRRAAGRAGAGLGRPADRRRRPGARRRRLRDDQPPSVPRRRDRDAACRWG